MFTCLKCLIFHQEENGCDDSIPVCFNCHQRQRVWLNFSVRCEKCHRSTQETYWSLQVSYMIRFHQFHLNLREPARAA